MMVSVRGRHFCFVLVMYGSLAGKAAATEHSGLIHHIRQVLATRAPTRAVTEMTATGDWGRVLARISLGDIGAIGLVRELARGSDAGAAEDLTISLAEALPKAPRNVLGVLTPDRDDTLSSSRVCSAPFIEDTSRHQRAYKAAALRAVRRVLRSRDPDLMRPGAACIAKLREIKG